MAKEFSGKIIIVVLAVTILFLSIILYQTFPPAERIRWVSDVTPASGPGSAPGGSRGDGPWNHRLLIAVSSDGVNWAKTYTILSDQASVPDVIVDRDGYTRVYYVDYYNGGIVVAISRDLGSWIYVRVKGLNSSWVDPSIAILPDGRFRLYASYMPPGGQQNKIISAVSDDGVYFVAEPGVRFEWSGVVTDPDIIYVDGKWVMYVEVGGGGSQKILMLTSEDGLNFELEGEVRVEGHVPCLIRVGNVFRLYVHRGDFSSILVYYSRDLREWTGPEVVLERGEPGSLDVYGVADPAVAKLPNGTYIMVYKTWIEKPVFTETVAEKFYRFRLGAKPQVLGYPE